MSEVDRRLMLKETYLDKINYYLTRNPISQDELYVFIRKFFGDYLKLDYEFTYEELSQELNKVFIKPQVKENIDGFLIRLSESEYLEEIVLGTAEINAFLKELAEIIDSMIYTDVSSKKDDSFIKKILNINTNNENVITSLSNLSYAIEQINSKITNGDVILAKKLYNELLKKYDSLNKEDKQKLHLAVTEVYTRLQTAIKNPNSITSINSSPLIDSSLNNSSGSMATSQSDYNLNAEVVVSDSVKKIRALIKETSFYLDAVNIPSAKNTYVAILKLYNSLSFEEKKQLHADVNDLYIKLQSASSYSSKSYKKSKFESKTNIISPSDLGKSTIEQGIKNESIKNIKDLEEQPLLELPELAVVSSSNILPTSSENTSSIKETSSNLNYNLDIDKDTGNNIILQSNSDLLKNNSNNLSTPDLFSKDVSSLKTSPTNFDNVLFTVPISNTESKNDLNAISNLTNNLNNNLNNNLSNKNLNTNNIIPDVVNANIVSKPVSDLKSTNDVPIFNSSIGSSNSTSNASISKVPDFNSRISQTNERIDKLFKKIEDDILLDELEKAKVSYADSLVIYNTMRNEEKILRYDKFYELFKKLDSALHKKTLGNLLDTHLISSKHFNSEHSDKSGSINLSIEIQKQQVPESKHIVVKSSTINNLPSITNNDSTIVRIYELIEEAYFNITNHNFDIAMLKYFKALEFYHKLSSQDKEKSYSDLHGLFKTMSEIKK